MLELSGIRVAHGRRTVLSVDRLCLGGPGLTAVLGHNGSGKSTLMRLLARESRPDAGTVTLEGTPLPRYAQRALARRLAHLPQHLPEAPGLSVAEFCALGRFPWRGLLGRWSAADRAATGQALAETGLSDLAGQDIDSLSGGERQRAWIAMLLAQEAPLLLLDEPISALDPAHQLEVLSLLRRLARSGARRVVAILHDVNLAARHADRIVALKQGEVVFDGPPEALIDADVLSRLYDVRAELVAHPRGGLPIATFTDAA
jgi:iron complex transport system ATP-binding protein